MLKTIVARYPKLATAASMILLVVSTTCKPLFLAAVHIHTVAWLAVYTDKLWAYAANIVIGGFFFSTAYLMYRPLEGFTRRCMNKTSASERGKTLVSRSLQLLYWGFVIFVGLTILAPELLSKLFLGVSIFTAALALALKDIANDFISGVFLHFSPKFEVGDSITLLGSGAGITGTVKDIGYLVTYIQTDEGLDVFSNGDLWSMPIRLQKTSKAS